MNGSISPIIVESIKADVGNDPIDDFIHILIVYDEVASRATSRANWRATRVDLASRMLIELGGNPSRNVSAQLCRAKAVG